MGATIDGIIFSCNLGSPAGRLNRGQLSIPNEAGQAMDLGERVARVQRRWIASHALDCGNMDHSSPY